jgi:uncharacterized protein (TIGR02145 family)
MMKRVLAFLTLGVLISGAVMINSCKKDAVLPSLTTSAVTNITINSGTSGGVITKDGGAGVTARGVCWSTTSNPSLSESYTSDATGTGTFTSQMTGLTPNTLYHVRAYATNKAGTAYGNEVTFTTGTIVVATITTTAVSAITLTSAVSGGNITSDGNGAVTARGVCWAITTGPTVTNDKTTDGTGVGTFTSNITGLQAAVTYYVRAYATNSAGTAYGNEVSFTTAAVVVPTLTTTDATLITLTTAVTGGNITDDGGANVTARGVCYATTAAPTITNSITTDGTDKGVFVSNLSGLTAGTLYHVRAYATNSAGTAYGNEITFTTTAIGAPVLTTAEATAITLTTATSGGNITADSGGPVTARGVCWATTTGPTTAGSKTTDGTGVGVFVSNLTGLTAGTTYYIRAYATNSSGTAYGNELSFSTTAAGQAVLTTTAVTAITLTTATSGGNITSDGGASVTARGVCWATTTGPTTTDSKTSDATGIGSFISNLTGLLSGTTYYIRAYATNSAGTAYGNELSFTTSALVVPTLTTTAITAITLTTASSGGNITADGGAAVTARGVCWATTLNPTIADSKTSDATGTGIFTSSLTALLPGTLYHVRAYATNSVGTAYGNDLTFTTTGVTVPVLTTAAATAITQTTATSGGNVTSDGGGTVTARGVCWATTTGPTITGSKTSDGTGTGAFVSNLTVLLPGTTYYIRSYATNSAGTGYGNEVSFTTSAVLLPTVTTAAVTTITDITAVSGGNVTADGGETVTARGICFATTATPTILNSITTDGTGTGVFTSNLTGLTEGTVYYVRAYATNSAGTAYGAQVVFSTNIKDVDGNSYKTVLIGTQLWMAENLKNTKFTSTSAAITNITTDAAWALDSVAQTAGYCWYNDDVANKTTYGAMYNWFAVATDNICPANWHVPSDVNFNTLELFLGVAPADIDLSWTWRGTTQGDQMKNTTGWPVGQDGTNTSGWSALPGGYRFYASGTSNGIGQLSYWWTSDQLDTRRAWYRLLDGPDHGVYKAAVEKWAGKYVRCVHD